MATRKWQSQDGELFDTMAQVREYEQRKPLLEAVTAVLVGAKDRADAADVLLTWFEQNFRVPKVREKRGPMSAEEKARRAKLREASKRAKEKRNATGGAGKGGGKAV